MKKAYILQQFDKAIEEGRIEAYYQPIVRTISNTICNTETMPRWIDEKYGMIIPEEFIPVLSEHHLMARFDRYIVEGVCQNIAFMNNRGHNIIPTSIRLSKDGLLESDMVSVIEQIVRMYNVPRDMLCFIVEQSMISEKTGKIAKAIESLEQLGYQVWLSEFSLNFDTAKLLNQFPFDEIMIDISRISALGELDKDILSSFIKVIKKFQRRTVVVGVETEEQWKIIKNIGFDKAQGTYLCKPLARQEVIPYIARTIYKLEKKAQGQYYDKICNAIKITEKPFAISEYDQNNFKILFMNETFRKVCDSIGMQDWEQIDYMINARSSTLSRKFRYQQEQTRLKDDFVKMDYSVNGLYFRIRSKYICENEEYIANELKMENITKNIKDHKTAELDKVFRVMYSMYDSIFLLQPDNRMLNVMRSPLSRNGRAGLQQEESLVDLKYVSQFVYPDDRAEFLDTVDYDKLKAKLQETESGFETKYFRTDTHKGAYRWKAHTYQYIPDMDWIICSTRNAPLYQPGLMQKVAEEFSGDPAQDYDKAVLSQLKNSQISAYLWKDTNRRIKGVSKRFIEDFHIKNPDAIIGKRDEDIGWIVDINKAIEEEENILKGGEIVLNHENKIIMNGATHSIVASREPVYQNGKIVGLIVEVIDLDDLAEEGKVGKPSKGIDQMTGLLSAQGMLDTVSEYLESMMNYHEKFAIIQIKFKEQKYNFEQYGPVISEKITLGIAAMLKDIIKNNAVLARLYAGSYTILKKYTREEDIRRFTDYMMFRLKAVKEIAGYKVTLYPEIKISFADQLPSNNEIISSATGGAEFNEDQRIRLEEQLNYYNLQMDTIVDTIPGGIALYEVIEGSPHITYASKGVAEISGRNPETFVEDAAGDMLGVFDQDKERLGKELRRAVETNTELNINYRLHHTDGSTVWVNMQGKIIGKQNGHPLFLGVFRNLSESTSIYETILDEAQAYIYARAKDDGEILYANLNVVTYARNHQIPIEEQYDTLRKACTEDKIVGGVYRSSNERKQYEIEYQGRNLLVFYVDGYWNGRESTICYVSDITAKYIEEREKAARESLLYLEAINSSYDMVLTFNITKDTYSMHLNGPFMGFDWSKFDSYTEMIEEVNKHIPSQWRHEELEMQAQLQKFHSGEHYFVNEHQLNDIEGNTHWVSDHVVYAKDPTSGDVIGIVLTMIIDDIVRERNQQKETLQNALDAAMKANRAKSQFLSNMSHDIRTPMNAILGYTSIASDHISEPEIIKDSLSKVQNSGKHLLDVINDILDMSRIDSGKERLNLADGFLDEMEAEIETLIEPLAEQKHIRFGMNNRNVKHFCVKADLPKIRRVIVNVLSNAIKFTSEGGNVHYSVEEKAAKDGKSGDYTIRIKDSGIGMSREFIEHIYELFAREHTSEALNVEGTGLGMAISKKYVDLMGGTIEVISEQGVGTEVIIRVNLEYSDYQREEPEEEILDCSFLLEKRVLVVDDSKLNREVGKMMLQDIGMIVETAENGSIAVETLEESEDGYFDCILMDIRMPVMDGLEASRTIRQSKRSYLQKVPIVALSANVFAEDIQTSFQAGMNAYIGKPFEREEFIKSISKFIK